MTVNIKELEKELIELVNKDNVVDIHIPKSNEYVINCRGQRLHVRSFFTQSMRAIVFGLHGYSIHANHPVHKLFAREFNRQHIGYITFDFHSHGHSEGYDKNLRFYVMKPEDLMLDVLSVIGAVYDGRDVSNNKNKPTFELNKKASKLPFFIMGQSMGGATALAASIELKDVCLRGTKNSLVSASTAALFSGSILCCPAIDVPSPGPIVTIFLKAIAIPFFGKCFVPDFLTPPEFPPGTLTRVPELHRYSELDTVNHEDPASTPHALRGSKAILLQSGDSIVSMGEYLQYIIVGHQSFILSWMNAIIVLTRLAFYYSIIHLLDIVLCRLSSMYSRHSVVISDLALCTAIIFIAMSYFRARQRPFTQNRPLLARRLDFPFVVFHDPDDLIVHAKGSKLLIDHVKRAEIDKENRDSSKNQISPSLVIREKNYRLQTYVNVPDGLHDLYATSTGVIINHALDLISQVLDNEHER